MSQLDRTWVREEGRDPEFYTALPAAQTIFARQIAELPCMTEFAQIKL